MIDGPYGFRVDPGAGLIAGPRKIGLGWVDRDGYVRVAYRGGYTRAHRVIWEAVNGPIPVHLEINHINGDKLDNRIANLELVTPSENVRHAVRTGLHRQPRGARAWQSQLTSDQVQDIRSRYVRRSRHANAAQLAEEFGVARRVIASVVVGDCYADAGGPVLTPEPRRRGYVVTVDEGI